MSKTFSGESRLDQARRKVAAAVEAGQMDQLDQEASAHLALLQQTNENLSRLHAQLEQADHLTIQLEEARRLSDQLEQAGHRLEGRKEPVAPASRPNRLVRLLGLAGVFLLGAVLGPMLGGRLSTIDWESFRRWSEGVWLDTAYRLGTARMVATPPVSGDAGMGASALGQQPAEPMPLQQEVTAIESAWPAVAPTQPETEAPAKDAVSRQNQAVPIEPAPPAPFPDAKRVDPWSGWWSQAEPEVAQPDRAGQQSAEDFKAKVPAEPPKDTAKTTEQVNPQAVVEQPPVPAVESASEAVPAQQPPSNKIMESLNGQFKI